MAISGSGGWIPSKGVMLKDGHLVWQGLCQNKPKSIVEQDLEVAAERLIREPKKIIQVHFVGLNSATLDKIVWEKLNGD